VVAVDCELEVEGCSCVKQLKVEEGDRNHVVTVATDFLKIHKFTKNPTEPNSHTR